MKLTKAVAVAGIMIPLLTMGPGSRAAFPFYSPPMMMFLPRTVPGTPPQQTADSRRHDAGSADFLAVGKNAMHNYSGSYLLAQVVPPKPPETPTIIAGSIDLTAPVLDLNDDTIPDNSVQKPKSAPADWAPPNLTRGRVIELVMCSDRTIMQNTPSGPMPAIDPRDKAEAVPDKQDRCNKGRAWRNDKAAVLDAHDVSQIEDYLVMWPANVVITEVANAIDPAHQAKKK